MDLLKSGQKLSLFFEKEGKIVEITCLITEVYSDRLVVDLPSCFMRYIEYLEEGERLTVKVFSKLGTIDFNTMVISSPLEDEFSIDFDSEAIKLTPNDEIPIINAIENLDIKLNETLFKVKTFELSTEYIKIYSDNTFELGTDFECSLFLPKKCGTITFRATVTEIDPVYDNEFTITFYNMTEEHRQKLLYYMYLYSNNID